jgi:hypothetical protein
MQHGTADDLPRPAHVRIDSRIEFGDQGVGFDRQFRHGWLSVCLGAGQISGNAASGGAEFMVRNARRNEMIMPLEPPS